MPRKGKPIAFEEIGDVEFRYCDTCDTDHEKFFHEPYQVPCIDLTADGETSMCLITMFEGSHKEVAREGLDGVELCVREQGVP